MQPVTGSWAALLATLVPLGLVIAISPLSIIPAVLVLQTPRPRPTGLAFLGGWLLGLVGMTAVFVASSDALGDLRKTPPTWASWLRVVLGLALKEFVAIPVNQHLGTTVFYTDGEQSPTLSGSFFSRLPDYAGHTALPALTLILVSYSAWAIYQRSSMIETLDADHVRLARAKGLSRRRVLIRHVLRNALIPVTTVIALDFAAVLGGAILVEFVFGWQGLGTWYITGVTTLDVNIMLAYLVVTATFVILFNLLADILYGVLDPRIRYA